MCDIIQSHNIGYGSSVTEASYILPVSLMDYIYGFGDFRHIRNHIEYRMKMKENQFIPNGVKDPSLWAGCGQDVINKIGTFQYGTKITDYY